MRTCWQRDQEREELERFHFAPHSGLGGGDASKLGRFDMAIFFSVLCIAIMHICCFRFKTPQNLSMANFNRKQLALALQS